MLRIVLFLGFLAVAILAVGQLADTPGHLVLLWGDTEYRVSLLVGILAVLVASFLFMLVWNLLRLALRLPSILGLYNRMRRNAKGQEAVALGLIAVGTGDSRAAARHARDSLRLLGETPLSLLLEAQAAQLSGNTGKAEQSFRTMLDKPETRALGLRGLFIEAERRNDAASARRFAAEALSRDPDSAWASEALLAFRAAGEDWRGAIALIDQRVSRRRIDRAEGRRQRAVMLAAAARDTLTKNPDEALELAIQALRSAPGLVPAAEIAARRLAAMGDYAKAAKLLEAAYRETPHPEIAEAYLTLRHGDSALDRLKRAKTLAKMAPNARESKFIVARAALDAREFAIARQELEALVLEKPTVRACLMMAELEQVESDNQGLVRSWLARASRAPRDPIWVGDGIVSENWAPVSPLTGRIGGFEWKEPPHAPEQDLRSRIDVALFVPQDIGPQSETPPGEAEKPAAALPAPEGAKAGAPAGLEEQPSSVSSVEEVLRAIIPDDPGPDPEARVEKKRRFFLFR